GATDILRDAILALDPVVASKAVFANTAVDRIVPGAATTPGLDVTVEAFFEWAIESGPFRGSPPDIPEAHFVDDLAPYIERKLFTVNTGHATAAYHGLVAGHSSIADAMADPAVVAEVRAVLDETKTLLVAKHEFDADVQQAYLEKNLVRFANPYLEDTVDRVGRQPLRKLSRNERFIGPASQLAERGLPADALLRTVGAALAFDVPEDPQSVEMLELLRTTAADEFVSRVTGLENDHPLFRPLVAVVAAHQK
ncbi:MAG: mannitol-1-phosphate 5-dehydrogenase, partial [Rhodoglobus sp.]